jgi:Bax protein
MKALMILVFILLFFTTNAQNKNYFNDYIELAKQMEETYKIPSCVILAVGYIESGGGISQVGKRLNNHFGIVGSSQPAISGYKSRYKYYPTVKDSFIGFCELVRSKKFYEGLKGSDDRNKWVKSLADTGYASDANKWSAKVIGIMNKYCNQSK